MPQVNASQAPSVYHFLTRKKLSLNAQWESCCSGLSQARLFPVSLLVLVVFFLFSYRFLFPHFLRLKLSLRYVREVGEYRGDMILLAAKCL